MARILIVDDAAFWRSRLKQVVESAGHQVVGLVKSGAEGLELFKMARPDVVLLDVLMEGGSGLAALQAIRKENPQAAVIMVSVLGKDQTIEQAKQLGAAAFITKPFEPEDLLAEIRKLPPP